METFTRLSKPLLVFTICLLASIINAFGQRNYATTQHNGTNGLCLVCSVADAASAADGNVQTNSTLNVSVGIGAQTYQELIFPASGKVPANTPVTVKLGSGDNLLNLTLLGGVLLQAYNENTPVGTPVAASTLVSALSNNNQTEVSITPNATYDRLRVTLDGGLLGVTSSIYVYDAFYNSAGPSPCNIAVDELHGISSALLGLGLNVGGVVNPQQAIDGDINTASTLNAGVGLAGAYTQQTVIFQNPSVQGDSVKLTMALPQALIDAGVLANISVQTYNGNTSNNDTQNLSGGLLTVRLLDLNGTRRKVTVTYAPTAVFDRIQVRLGGGIASALSSLDLYEVQRVIPSPVIKYNNVVTNSVQICSGTAAALVANSVPNTTFNWYTVPTGGSTVGTGATFTTPQLTTTTTYYVEAVRTGCTDASARTKVVVNVNTVPVAPTVTNPDITICQGSTATFAVQAIVGVTINWYTAATGGTPVFTGDSFTTGPLSATATYYAEASTGGGQCISTSRTSVTATVSTPPDVPTLTAANVTICDGDLAVLSVASPVSGVVYNWYSAATGGTLLTTGTTFTSPALHANTNYYVEAVNATGCSSTTRAQATVTVQPKPADPTLVPVDNSINAGQTATITVSNNATGVTYNWYTSATAGSSVYTGTTYNTPALYATTTYYVSAVNSTGCQSANRTAITITVNINTNTPCSFANAQTSNVNGICIACSIANNALAIDADTTTASTIHVVAGLLGGYAEQELRFPNAGFSGDTIKIGLQSPVGLADLSLLGSVTITLYNGTTAVNTYTLDNNLLTLRLLGPGNKYAAYVPATGAYDRATIRLNAPAVGALTSLNVYYAIQQFAKPVINPTAPEVCKGSTAQINITSPANGGTFTWYNVPTGGTALSTNTNYTTDPLTANTTYYIEYTRNGCVSPVRFPVMVLVDDVPTAPIAAVSPVNINSGQTATLTATAQTGAVVKWYEAATGGTAVFTGNNFVTPPLSADKTYYAEAALGNCVSPVRTPVAVTVTAVVIPDVTVTPPTVAINPGTTASFTASSTTPGVIFKWYTAATGGTSIYTGANFTSPPLFANTTYYAEAVVQATGAVSTTRAPGAVTLNVVNSNATPCDAAIDQTNATSGLLCLGCGVNNAAAAVDADRNTFSQLLVPVGLLNAYAQQTLRFAATGRAGDSVIVELGTPGALADIGVLSGISLATYNGSTYNNDRTNINTALLSISLLNGDSRFRVAIKANADFDRVEIRLNAAVAGVFNSLNIYDAAQEVAAPVISTANVTACAGSQATITATAPDYVTVKWYTTPAGGSPVFTGSVFTTPALTATTTYYAEASRTADGCAQTVRTPATVTVTPLPDAPVVPTSTVTVCSGSPATFAVTPVSGVTYSWYTAATGGTPVFTGNSYTTDPLTVTTSFYVEASNGSSCANSTRTQVTANVSNSVNDPSVDQTTVQTCSGSSAVLTATSTQPGVTFNWYTAATAGTPIFTGAQYITPALTANASYYVEAAAGSCVSTNRVKVDVNVNPTPDAPTVTVAPGSQITSGQTATITASSTTGGATFNWYTSPTGGTPIFTGAAYTTPVLTSNTTYYVESALATGCASARVPVTITVNPIFSTTCDFASTQTNVTNGGLLCLGCSVTNPDNAVDNDQTNYSTLNMLVGAAGYVSQTLIFGEPGGNGDTVSVRLHFPVSILSAGVLDRLTIRSYNNTTDNGDAVALSSSLLRLQLLSGDQTVLFKFAPHTAFDRVEIRLAPGVGLLSSVDIGYASKQVEAPQLATNTVNICAGTTATFTVSNARAGVSYDWFSTPTGGTSLHTGNTYTTDPLSITTTFYVQSSRTANSCPNPNRVAATANVTPSPGTPTLAANSAQICAGDNVILSVTNAAGYTVNWYDAATGGNLVFTGPNFQVAPVLTTSYYAELSNSTCTSPTRTQATITVNPRPAKPGVQSANVQVCSGGSVTLSVLNPEAGVTYDWYDAATGGTLVHTGTTYTAGPITQNTAYYIQATAAGGCINNNGRTQVNVNTSGQIGNPVLSSTSTQVCAGGSVSISVINPVSGIQYNWYTSATGGTLVYTGTTYTINNLINNVSYFVEADNSAGCSSAARTETDITVQPLPQQPTVQASAGGLTVCQGGSASLSIANPQSNEVYRWFNAGGTLLFTGTQFNTPALVTNTTYYVEAAAAGNCNPSARTAVTVTVVPLPTDPTLVASTVQVCTGSSATFTISNPQANVKYEWYDSPSQTNKLFEGNTFVTGPITTNTTFYVGAQNINGCGSTNLTSVQATTLAPPPAPIVANGNAVTVCNGTAAILTISNPQTGYTYNWYSAATGGTLVASGTTFNTGALNANVSYYAEAVSAAGCISTSRTPVNITLTTAPGAPTVSSTGTEICSGSTTMISASNVPANTTIYWYAASTGGTAVGSGSTFTTPVLNANTTYYAEAVSTTGGCSSLTRTPVAIVVRQPLSAPVVTVAATTNNSVTFQWSPVAGAGSYQVSLDNGITFITPSSGATGTTHMVTGLAVNTTVTIIVRANGTLACQLGVNSAAVKGTSNNPLGNQIFVPNAFTPNGDGKNDILYVYGTAIKSVTFSIYDQYGQLMFKGTSQANGWDGTFKGSNQPVAVYVYYVEAIMNDGETVNKKGSVTLLR